MVLPYKNADDTRQRLNDETIAKQKKPISTPEEYTLKSSGEVGGLNSTIEN
ncbi:MAG: hypothetical protein PHE96_06085 [Methylococcales bacterium]|nr:hypothetical protein [Methylococcales bacterium]